MNNFFVYYLIDSTNDEIFYVGKASWKRRFNDHLSESKKSTSLKCKRIQLIYKKAGTVNFKIIKDFATEKEALEFEKQEIKKFGKIIDNTGCLTNIQDGGTQPPKRPTKTVYMFNKSGKLLKSFPNTYIAAKELEVSHSIPRRCCSGLSKTCKGFILSYNKSLSVEELQKRLNNGRIKNKKIYQLDNNHNIINIYNSLYDASKSINVLSKMVGRAIKKQQKCRGFYWSLSPPMFTSKN